jgi:GAF domain-containing protein
VNEPGGLDEVELAETFATIARQMQRQDTPEETWQAIADLSVQTLGFQHCGISIVYRNGGIKTPAASGELPVQVDAIQYETGEGPCLGAIRYEDKYLAVDLAQEERWPTFARRTVEETGVRSMLSLRLFSEGDVLGAMNFYSEQTDAFDARSEAVAGVLAAHAAVAMSAAQDEGTVDQLEEALEGSRVISTAVGILMVQTGSSQDRAFQLLSQSSQRSNVKVRTIADRIVAGQENDHR